MSTILETDRLILRPPSKGDAEALAIAINHGRIAATTLNIPHPYSVENAIEWIEKVKDPESEPKGYDFSIFIKETGELIGGISLLDYNEKHRRAELGYWCAPDHWGRGYTTEAAKRIVQFGFEKMNLERIFATCFTSNPASAHVMVKIGMKFEGTARCEVIKNGVPIDLHHYAIIRSDL